MLPTTVQGVVIRPMEAALQVGWSNTEVTFHLMPVATRGQANVIDREMDADSRKKYRKTDKGKGKASSGKQPGSGKGGKRQPLPYDLKGCWTHIRGEVARRFFNFGKCSSEATQPGEKCNIGLH